MEKEKPDNSTKFSILSLIMNRAAELSAKDKNLKHRTAVALASKQLRDEGVFTSEKRERPYKKKLRNSVNIEDTIKVDYCVTPSESTFESNVNYMDSKNIQQTASVRVVINYKQNKFDLYNSMGNKDFCFVNNSHNSAQWLAVLEAAQNAILFAKKELGK